MKNKKGFTLLEAIIYIALLSVIMGGVLPTVYQLLKGSGNLSVRNTVQEEGNFVLRKIVWVLTGIKSIDATGASLTVTKVDLTQVSIRLESGALWITEGGNDLPLTTHAVSVSGLQFRPIGSPVAGVTASFTIDGVLFETTHYLRK